MTVKEIIYNFLKENNFDGLCNYDCGCDIDDLCACDNYNLSCEPAYKVYCNECKENDKCIIENNFENNFCYRREKI